MSLLDRVGLTRPELRAWALYDWANSAMVTTVVTAVFPIYFASVVAAGLPPAEATRLLRARHRHRPRRSPPSSRPALGTLADLLPWKKRLLGAFVALGAASTAALWFVGPGDAGLAATLFVLGNVGLNGSFVFYDALLPHVARDGRARTGSPPPATRSATSAAPSSSP